MGSSNLHFLARPAWELAKRQHGVVARRQLLELGMSAQAVQHRVAKGRLHRIHRGVYVVGRPEVSQLGRWMAAVLACGPRAVLSHGSAAALWGIGSQRAGDEVEVSVPATSVRHRDRIRVHRRSSLAPVDLTSRDRIPVTGLIRTLLDVAHRSDPSSLERTINEADRLGLIDPETLSVALEDYSAQRGVGKLRELLGRHTFVLTDSELERRFLPIAAAAGLPPPLTQQWLNGFRVDFYWPDLGLVVETDGLWYHRTPAQQARDHRRDQAHTAAGLVPLRFTHAQVRFEVNYVRLTLIAVANRLYGTRAA